MDNETLGIEDSDQSTEGGPPGWIAWGVIVAAVTLIVITALVFGVLL